MPVKIAPCPNFDAAAEKIVEVWRGAGSPKLIRKEGFDGAGKSGLAKLVKERIGAEHVEGDKFAFKPDKPTPYRDCLRRDEFDAELAKAIATGRVVIVDAVCLEEVAPSERWGRGFVVPDVALRSAPGRTSAQNGSAPLNSHLPQRGEAASHRGLHS